MFRVLPLRGHTHVLIVIGLLLVAGCSAAAAPTPTGVSSPSADPTPSPTAAPTLTLEPTPTVEPTATPSPTPVGELHLGLDLSITYALGLIEGPGTCDIGANGIWVYLEHRRGIVLDAYVTLGPAAGGISGDPVTGGGSFGPEVVRIRVADTTTGAFLDAEEAHAEIAPDLQSGTLSGTWKGEPLSGTYTCG